MENASDSNDSTPQNVLRRQFLKKFGSAALAGVGASSLLEMGCSRLQETPAQEEASGASRNAPRPTYSRTVNARELGWDPQGNTPIDDSLAQAVQSGWKIEVPPGEYLVTEPVEKSGLQNFGLVGTGEERGEVAFTSPNGTAGFYLLNLEDTENIELGNFTIDWKMRRDTAGAAFRILCRDGFYLHDVEWIGYTPPSDPGDDGNCHKAIPPGAKRNLDIFKLFVQITDPDGRGLIECLKVAGPSHIDGHKGGQGLVVHPQNFAGTMHYLDCHFENVNGDAPVYSSGFGTVIFENCFVKNCAMGCIRMGGDSEVRNCVVVQDHSDQPAENTGQFCAANGIFWASQLNEQSGGLIEDTDIVMRNLSTPGNAVRIHTSSGGLTLRNVNIFHDADSDCVITYDPLEKISTSYGDYTSQKPWGITMENVNIVGETATEFLVRLDRRHGSRLHNVCLDAPNAKRGVWVRGSNDVSIQDCNFNVGGEPLVSSNSRIAPEDYITDGTCTPPEPDITP